MDLSYSECDVISLYLCVTQLMDLFALCVACFTVNCELFGDKFAMCLGVVAILLLNVMNVFSVGGGALLDRPCMGFPKNLCVVSVIPVCI